MKIRSRPVAINARPALVEANTRARGGGGGRGGGTPRALGVGLGRGRGAPPAMAARRRRALCIGINYYGTGAQLGGCVNDTKLMSAALRSLGFKPEDIEVLTDEPGRAFSGGGASVPTRANIEAACRRLVEGAAAGDSLFFHYSGHGGRSVNYTGAERTG